MRMANPGVQRTAFPPGDNLDRLRLVTLQSYVWALYQAIDGWLGAGHGPIQRDRFPHTKLGGFSCEGY